ncbi:hypothetical protein O181_072261 [Austropuccinia psidii MF-1]|uniref:Uncharacterized protein n=1 Tax=Austropuccinia psidii MF-1 TaxID=1389203 RepID=A0A9Q3F2C1_9BASI|nr:hypothetical protein [Austropuccinia psidii MF-1]
MAFLGHLGSLQPLRPMVHGTLRPKRGQGEVHQLPNHKWAHLIQVWPQIPTNPKQPKTTSGPELTNNHLWATIQPMASGNHQRPSAHLLANIPLSFSGRLFFSQCTPYSRIQE